jgi:hypothetical protein
MGTRKGQLNIKATAPRWSGSTSPTNASCSLAIHLLRQCTSMRPSNLVPKLLSRDDRMWHRANRDMTDLAGWQSHTSDDVTPAHALVLLESQLQAAQRHGPACVGPLLTYLWHPCPFAWCGPCKLHGAHLAALPHGHHTTPSVPLPNIGTLGGFAQVSSHWQFAYVSPGAILLLLNLVPAQACPQPPATRSGGQRPT